ncbi:MAG: hypothetical protein ACHQNT_02530 [Bacteroidia bacterium]
MNADLHRTIIKIIGEAQVREIYFLAGSVAVSFAALLHVIKSDAIDEDIRQKKSNQQIARDNCVCEKTVERHRRRLLFEDSKKHRQKK